MKYDTAQYSCDLKYNVLINQGHTICKPQMSTVMTYFYLFFRFFKFIIVNHMHKYPEE